MTKSAIADVHPFIDTEEDMQRVEYLEKEVDLLRNEVNFLMQTVTLLTQVENYRIEKIRKK